MLGQQAIWFDSRSSWLTDNIANRADLSTSREVGHEQPVKLDKVCRRWFTRCGSVESRFDLRSAQRRSDDEDSFQQIWRATYVLNLLFDFLSSAAPYYSRDSGYCPRAAIGRVPRCIFGFHRLRWQRHATEVLYRLSHGIMKGSGAERPCAMLGMVKADHLRMSDGADTDEVCPFVAKVIAQKNISVVRHDPR